MGQSQDQIIQDIANDDNVSKSSKRRGNSQNIFGKQRSSSRPRDNRSKDDELSIKMKEERLERDFEKKCQKLIKAEDWQQLDTLSTQHLEYT